MRWPSRSYHLKHRQKPRRHYLRVLEPRVVTFEDIESSEVLDAFQHPIVARTVRQWSAADKSALILFANPPHQHVYLTRNTVLGSIVPISAVPNTTTSAAHTNSKTTEFTRHELREALTINIAFDKTTFSLGECEQVLDSCTKYQSVPGIFFVIPRARKMYNRRSGIST